MKLRSIILPVLAACSIMAAQIGSANAYFTTHVTAKGYNTVNWQHSEHIQETFNEWTKYVSIKSEPNSIPIFVRAKVFYGDLGYDIDIQGGDWKLNSDGYYYYQKPLPGGEVTSDLLVHIKDWANKSAQAGDNFNVIVVYECIPATYNQAGEPTVPEQASWDNAYKS